MGFQQKFLSDSRVDLKSHCRLNYVFKLEYFAFLPNLGEPKLVVMIDFFEHFEITLETNWNLDDRLVLWQHVLSPDVHLHSLLNKW